MIEPEDETIILRSAGKYSIFFIEGLTSGRAASSVAIQHRRCPLYSEQSGDKKDSLYMPIDTAYKTTKLSLSLSVLR